MKKIFRNIIIIVIAIVIIAAIIFALKDKSIVNKILNNEYSDVHGTIVDQRIESITISEGIICVANDDSTYDYYNVEGKKLSEESFWDCLEFKYGYGACSKGPNKYGIIDKEGNTIVEFENDFVYVIGENRFLVENQESDKLLDENGNVILEENNCYINKLDENLLIVTNMDDNTSRFIDYNGKTINTFANTPNVYFGSEDMILFEENDLWGFMDSTGKVAIKPQFKNASSFKNGYALVEDEDSIVKFIDKEGKDFCAIPDEYSYYVSNLNDNGLIICETMEGKVGVINTEGNIVVEFDYDYIGEFSEGFAVVSKDGKYGYIDSNGNIAFELGYDMCQPFENGTAFVNKDDAWMLIDNNGNSVDNIKYKYGDISMAEEGYAYVSNDYYYEGLLNTNTGKLEYGDISFDDNYDDDPNYYYYGIREGHYKFDFYENEVK